MKPHLVSVVIPCHNAEHFVVAACRSVLAQGVDLEIIVVDDGSRDGSVAALEASGLPVRLLRQANQGVSAARNAGVAAARGEWIAFIDADDIWLPGKLRAQLALLSQHPDARMAYTAWHVWHCDDPEPSAELLAQLNDQARDPLRWAGPSGDIYPELLTDCVVWTSTVLIERNLFQQAGGFDPALRIGEDYDLWLRCSRLTPVLRVPAPLALYRMHGANVTHRAQSRNHRGEIVGRALAQWGYASAHGKLADRSAVNRGLARSWADHAGDLLMCGDPRAARTAAALALHYGAGNWLGWAVYLKSLCPWLPWKRRTSS